MKRVLPLLLLLLSVFFGTPPQCICFCEPISVTQLDLSEHSCCKSEVDNTVSSDRRAAFSNKQECCGMIGTDTPCLANPVDLLRSETQARNQIAWIGRMNEPEYILHEHRAVQGIRAPPYLTGLGTRYTYLFKRTLII